MFSSTNTVQSFIRSAIFFLILILLSPLVLIPLGSAIATESPVSFILAGLFLYPEPCLTPGDWKKVKTNGKLHVCDNGDGTATLKYDKNGVEVQQIVPITVLNQPLETTGTSG